MGKNKTVRITRKKKSKKGNNLIKCPYCGAYANYQSADGIYKDNSGNKMLYVCSNYPECDSYVRVIDGTKKPMGTMANKELRKLRNDAHFYFNKLYQYGYMTREEAYMWLADIINAPYMGGGHTGNMGNAHIGNMGEYYCKLVIEKSKEYLSSRRVVSKSDALGLKVIGGGLDETERKRKAVS